MSMIGNLTALSPAQLDALIADPSGVEGVVYPEDGEPAHHVDLDKAWHAIHYTLCGRTWDGDEPLGLALLGGTELGEDIGYGPARYLEAAQVQAIAVAPEAITPEDFGARFDPKGLSAAKIYPQIWDDGLEALDYVQAAYKELRSFHAAAAKRADAALVYIN